MNDAGAASTGGWEAIETALKAVYGDQKPLHWGAPISYSLGGPDPIDGISAYRHDGDEPHWHLVTFGFSELYAKESGDPGVSGCGFELTLRLPAQPEEAAPPGWALNFLQNLARYVFEYGAPFAAGHHLNLNGPICLESDTAIRAVLFGVDPELGSIQTLNGSLTFLQVVGVTLDELAAAKAWDTLKLLEIMATRAPLLVTDLDRRSMLEDSEVQAAAAEGAARDGSSTGALYVGAAAFVLENEGLALRLTLGANGVRDVCSILRGRIAFGRDLVVASSTGEIVFTPSEQCAWEASGEQDLQIWLTAEAADALYEAIEVRAGEYGVPLFPGLIVDVVKSRITDQDGAVVEVIG
jgi:suppressor of fused-like protein